MRHLRTLSTGAFVLLANVAPSLAQAFHGDAARSGVFPATTKPSLAGFAWRFQTAGDVISSPTVSAGVAYIGSGDGKLYALDARTGAKKWAYEAGSPIASSPAVSGGRVYAGARSGEYFALDAATGKKLWSFRTGPDMPLHWGHESGDHWISSPVAAQGTVVFGGGDGWVYALGAEQGTLRWKQRTGGRVRSSPAISGNSVVVGSFDGRLYAFSLGTGKPLWVFKTAGDTLESGEFGYDRRSIQSSPSIAAGVVFVGARDGILYAIDIGTGHEKWHFDHKISWVNATAAVEGGIVYTASSDAAFVQAVDAESGKERWRYASDVPVWSSPAVSGNFLYVGDWVGRLHAIDRTDGKGQWKFRTGSMILGSPAVSGDLVIVGSTDGAVYAVRTSDAPVQRVVFFDSAYVKASRLDATVDLGPYFARRGYAPMNVGMLRTFMEARVQDRAPSVVVFAIDFVPESLAAKPYATSLFRRYLEAGGKVVWAGMPPALWPRDSAGERVPSLLAIDWSASSALLGVATDAAIFDDRGVHATADGLEWGLPPRWRDAWSVDTKGVTTVLGVDEWGLAAAWVKRYGGPPGTGFVRVPASDPYVVYLAAEFRPGP